MFKLIHMPLKGAPKVSSPFGFRNYKTSWWHNGVDFVCNVNTPVYAVADGKVEVTQVNVGGGGYGLYIVLSHGGAGTLYAHLNKSVVKVGQQVKAGELIGYSGNTGESTGPHLHFEVRLCRSYMNFWERDNYDRTVFMRCVDPQMFIDDYLARQALTVPKANAVIQKYAGLDTNTISYLNFYKYDTALVTKLAKAII